MPSPSLTPAVSSEPDGGLDMQQVSSAFSEAAALAAVASSQPHAAAEAAPTSSQDDRAQELDDDAEGDEEQGLLPHDGDGNKESADAASLVQKPILQRLYLGIKGAAGSCCSRILGCIKWSLHCTHCCCPSCIRHACRERWWVHLCWLLTLLVLLIVVCAAGWHVYDAYADSPEGRCLHTAREANDFNYVLKSIAEVCAEHKLSYWLDFGVLLGGVTRGAPLPWDRDIDLSILESTLWQMQNNRTVRQAFLDRGMYPCPKRKCMKPLWTNPSWPEVDLNVWTIDDRAGTAKYFREKNDDLVREAVFSKYSDFDVSLLYPLGTMMVGGTNVSVPHDPDGLLRHRYPHSYPGMLAGKLPYNPRCWVAAIIHGLPGADAAGANAEIFLPPNADQHWVQMDKLEFTQRVWGASDYSKSPQAPRKWPGAE